MFSICASSLSDSPVFPVWSRSELNDWHKFRISSRQCDTCQSSDQSIKRYYFFQWDTLFLIQPAISRSLVSAKVGGKENKGKRPPDCRLFLIMHPGHLSTETWRNVTKQAHGSVNLYVVAVLQSLYQFSRLFPGHEYCSTNFKTFSRIQDSARSLLPVCCDASLQC